MHYIRHLALFLNRKSPINASDEAYSPFFFFISRSYFSAPTHSFAAGHQSRQVCLISLVTTFPHLPHTASISSDHISTVPPQKMQIISSGKGLFISALPGHPSLKLLILYIIPGYPGKAHDLYHIQLTVQISCFQPTSFLRTS